MTRAAIDPVRRSAAAPRELSIRRLRAALGCPSAQSRVDAAAFDKLRRLVESLPLDTEEFCFASNWVASAQQLWEKGERGAARYQIDIVRKKFALWVVERHWQAAALEA